MTDRDQRELRIFHVINDLSIASGAEGMLVRLAAKMLEHDVKSRVVSLGGMGTLGQKAIDAGVDVTALGIKSFLDLPGGIFKLTAEIKKYDPHIIQTWLYHSDFLGLMANWISGNRPLVWNLRCSNIDLYEENRRTAFLLKVLAPLSPLPDLVLANSDAALAYHLSAGFKPKAQKVIANGFCGDHFQPSEHRRKSLRAEWGVTENDVLIGMIARVAAMKDHDIFLDVALSISAERPNIKFLLAGTGTEPNMPLAQSQKALALKDKILWLGPRSDIQDIMSALDIATLTSKCGESFPNVLAEAMLCGVPCVATDVGAAASIIGDTGLVIPSGKPACLMKAWGSIATLSTRSRQMLGASARKRILEHFSLEVIARQYADTYRQMLR